MTTTTVELRFNDANEIVCDWGAFGGDFTITAHYHPGPRTVTVDNVKPLILVSASFADTIAKDNEIGGAVTIYTEDGRRFIRIDASNGSWTWELFPARWWDGAHRIAHDILVGRWPD